MNHSTGKPTKAQAARFEAMHALGCLACLLDGRKKQDHCGWPEIHHFLRGGKRIGHDATVPLAPWHHTATLQPGQTTAGMLAKFGPSFHRHTRAFRERYGSDAEVIAKVNDLLGATA